MPIDFLTFEITLFLGHFIKNQDQLFKFLQAIFTFQRYWQLFFFAAPIFKDPSLHFIIFRSLFNFLDYLNSLDLSDTFRNNRRFLSKTNPFQKTNLYQGLTVSNNLWTDLKKGNSLQTVRFLKFSRIL